MIRSAGQRPSNKQDSMPILVEECRGGKNDRPRGLLLGIRKVFAGIIVRGWARAPPTALPRCSHFPNTHYESGHSHLARPAGSTKGVRGSREHD